MASNLRIETCELYVPTLLELKQNITEILKENYKSCDVQVVDCPDLSQYISGKGICGNCSLIDLGGEPNLFYPDRHKRSFNLTDIAHAINRKDGFFIGAGACSVNQTGVNGELVIAEGKGHGCSSHWSKCIAEEPGYEVSSYESGEIGLMANMLVSNGERDKVIRICCSSRISEETNLISCLRQGILKRMITDNTKQIAMAGLVRVLKGRIHSHVMPDFVDDVLKPGPQIEKWLNFFEMGPHLNCMSTFITGDPTNGNLNLRLEHTHFYSDDGKQAGHYHFSTTPKEIMYECYLVPCERVYRIENAYKY